LNGRRSMSKEWHVRMSRMSGRVEWGTIDSVVCMDCTILYAEAYAGNQRAENKGYRPT
jgi:hypothetical protein